MLEQLDVRDGQRVLEIGTGAGYNAALLAARLGDENVTTIEVDPAVAARARQSLDQLGYHPRVVCGDGAEGYPAGAPYDRVIATCAVQWTPYAWVAQTRPGGVILVPRATTLLNEGMVRLVVAEDGTASGPFVAPASFMHLRDQAIGWRSFADAVHEDDDERHSSTRLDPRELADDYDLTFALSLRLDGVQRFPVRHGDALTVWLTDMAQRPSWACVDYQPGETGIPSANTAPATCGPWWKPATPGGRSTAARPGASSGSPSHLSASSPGTAPPTPATSGR